MLSFLFLWFQITKPISNPSQIVQFFEQGSQHWEPLMAKEANWLFYTLAGIDCVWLFISKVGETKDIQDAWNHIMPRIVGLLFWFNLVRLGLPLLINIPLSFMQLGKLAANVQAMTPSGILADGFSVAAILVHNAYDAGASWDLLTGAMFGLAGCLIILGYFIVCVHFMMALIEMWVALRSAFLFVGFSGSRWTEPYAERYITLLISTGLRLMILELIVGFGHQFATDWWMPAAKGAPYDDAGIMMGLEVAIEALLFGVICWLAPAKIAGILSGSPALSAASVSSFVAPLAQAAIAGTTMIYSNISGGIAQGARSAAAAAASAFGGASGTPPQPQPAPAPTRGMLAPPQPKPKSNP